MTAAPDHDGREGLLADVGVWDVSDPVTKVVAGTLVAKTRSEGLGICVSAGGHSDDSTAYRGAGSVSDDGTNGSGTA